MTCRPTCIKPTPTQAHCAAGRCHRTFGSVTAFDRHRRGGECLHPEEVGMRERNGIWRTPGPDPTVKGWPRGTHREPQTAETASGVVPVGVEAPEAAETISGGGA